MIGDVPIWQFILGVIMALVVVIAFAYYCAGIWRSYE